MPLLVSVRSAEEAEAALAGGAALIDVKEPGRGPLGRADDAVIRAVVQTVAGRQPVSAALGELSEQSFPCASSLTFVKWGLAGVGPDWRDTFIEAAKRLTGAQAVLVAYVDAERASAPGIEEVVAFACRRLWPAREHVLLLDTFDKNPSTTFPSRPTLLDWLSVAEVVEVCQRCRAAGVRVALAGSLGIEEIRRLLPARPDWFAVRGAACEGRDRQQGIDADRVRALVRLLGVEGLLLG